MEKSSLNLNICKICGSKIEDNYHYWSIHKIKESKYFEDFYPKYDLLTGDKIIFKNRDNYFQTHFLNKNNLKKYCKNLSKNDFYNFYKQLLKERKEQKNLTYAPATFETKTLLLPPISYVIKIIGIIDYLELCNYLNLKVRYNYIQGLNINDVKKFEIITDTREQARLKFNFPTEIAKLNVGDYAPNPNTDNIFIERKSLNDYCTTIGQGFERFSRELNRAKQSNSYVFVIIEEPFKSLQSIEYLPHTKRVKASSEFLLHQCRNLYKNFDNFQIICCENRNHAVKIIETIFKTNKPQEFDWQYLIDDYFFHFE